MAEQITKKPKLYTPTFIVYRNFYLWCIKKGLGFIPILKP